MEDRECSQEKSRLAIAVVGGEIKSRARTPPGRSVHERQRRGKSAGKKDRRGARISHGRARRPSISGEAH